MRLLIIEDNAELADALAAAFARRGVATDRAATAEDGELMLAAVRYAAAILDLSLPDRDGLSVLRSLRAAGDRLPVLILTARGSVDERIAGLTAGADDYIVKPFDVEELQARLDAVLRRGGGLAGRALALDGLSLDLVNREVTLDDRPLPMSARETELLELLLRRAGRIVPKRLVEDQLFGMTGELGSNAVEVYTHRLRRRLQQSGAPVVIETVRGVGYLLRPAP